SLTDARRPWRCGLLGLEDEQAGPEVAARRRLLAGGVDAETGTHEFGAVVHADVGDGQRVPPSRPGRHAIGRRRVEAPQPQPFGTRYRPVEHLVEGDDGPAG